VDRDKDMPATASPPQGLGADLCLDDIAGALRRGDFTATDLVESAIERHEAHGGRLAAYKNFDPDSARAAAAQADARIAAGSAGPFCGIPISVKDLYGVDGLPTFAGTARRLPDVWSRDAWLVAELRAQGAVIMGKTHTVELAYGAVGINPHWGTPWNPWDADTHRIPGGSSCGAGVSLWEGSALVALGSDTGGSIRIPAAMTGTVGHKITHGRWPVKGVVPLSSTLDSVGGLTRSVEDSLYLFGSIDPAWGDPKQFLWQMSALGTTGLRVAMPHCGIWDDCQADVSRVLRAAISDLKASGCGVSEVEGRLLDDAHQLYMTGGIAGAECMAFLKRDLPEWLDLLHPTVGSRLATAPGLDSDLYRTSVATRAALMSQADALFDKADVVALPASMATPAPVSELGDLERYGKTNATALRPTCPISMLGLCAITLPVGLDDAGMPVGLQLVAPSGQDEALLGAALAVERVLGPASKTLGRPPRL